MPSKTISTSAANWARIIAALNASCEREEVDGVEETDEQFYTRWLKGTHIELVFKYERRQAEGVIAPDDGIADVT